MTAGAPAPMTPAGTVPRVVTVSRGDPLTPYLHAAVADRWTLIADIGVELAGARRAAVAAATFRPRHEVWAENYMKSNLGFRARSRLAGAALRRLEGGFDVVLQTHCLFTTGSEQACVYVDCTYREAEAGWPDWTPHRGRARERWLAAETELFHTARHLFTLTGPSRRSLLDDYGVAPERVTVVGAGINFTRPTADPADTPNPAREREFDVAPTILFVGKDFVRKGGDVLLQAFATVRREVPDARLQIVGPTSLPGPTPDGVELVGPVRDRDRMQQLYRRATVFCLPSRFDPAPLVVLEAMASGLPCVLSDASSHHVRGIVDAGAGLRTPTGDGAALTEGLLEFLRDPVSARGKGEAARQKVIDGHQWRHVVGRMAPAVEGYLG